MSILLLRTSCHEALMRGKDLAMVRVGLRMEWAVRGLVEMKLDEWKEDEDDERSSIEFVWLLWSTVLDSMSVSGQVEKNFMMEYLEFGLSTKG